MHNFFLNLPKGSGAKISIIATIRIPTHRIIKRKKIMYFYYSYFNLVRFRYYFGGEIWSVCLWIYNRGSNASFTVNLNIKIVYFNTKCFAISFLFLLFFFPLFLYSQCFWTDWQKLFSNFYQIVLTNNFWVRVTSIGVNNLIRRVLSTHILYK